MVLLRVVTFFTLFMAVYLMAVACSGPSTTSTVTSIPTQSYSQQVSDFLAGAHDRYASGLTCGSFEYTPLGGIAPSDFESLAYTDNTTVLLGGQRYEYGVMALGYQPTFASVSIGEYDIRTGPPPTPAVSGGQSFLKQAYRNGNKLGEFVFFEVPVQIDSYSVFAGMNAIDELKFLFMYYKPDCNSEDRLWLVLLPE
jgi:hypothetical protein